MEEGMTAKQWLWLRMSRYDVTYGWFLKVEEWWCLLRGPHDYRPLFANTDAILVCEKCSSWVFPDGSEEKVAYR